MVSARRERWYGAERSNWSAIWLHRERAHFRLWLSKIEVLSRSSAPAWYSMGASWNRVRFIARSENAQRPD